MDAPTAPRLATLRRAMTVADLPDVMAIEALAYSHPWSHGNFVDSLAAGHHAEVVQAERLVGYFVAMVGVGEMHLLNLTIAPPCQRQGHGLALLEAVLAGAQARALATVWLEVRAGNARARALYTRRGFEEVGVRRGYYPAAQRREDAVVMRLAVSQPAGVAAPAAGACASAGGGHALE